MIIIIVYVFLNTLKTKLGYAYPWGYVSCCNGYAKGYTFILEYARTKRLKMAALDNVEVSMPSFVYQRVKRVVLKRELIKPCYKLRVNLT